MCVCVCACVCVSERLNKYMNITSKNNCMILETGVRHYLTSSTVRDKAVTLYKVKNSDIVEVFYEYINYYVRISMV